MFQPQASENIACARALSDAHKGLCRQRGAHQRAGRDPGLGLTVTSAALGVLTFTLATYVF